MSYPLPSIFIAPRRAERMAERADQRATELYVQLRWRSWVSRQRPACWTSSAA
jgi:guanylate kinase